MLLTPLETSIVFIIIIATSIWWRLHGQREQALRYAKAHCLKLNINLLDDYVALKSIVLKRDSNHKLRLTNSYYFEFTVTGEQRYTGIISLFGYYLDTIELPPYIYEHMPVEADTSIIEQNIQKNYLEKYPRYHKKL